MGVTDADQNSSIAVAAAMEPEEATMSLYCSRQDTVDATVKATTQPVEAVTNAAHIANITSDANGDGEIVIATNGVMKIATPVLLVTSWSWHGSSIGREHKFNSRLCHK